MRSRRGTSVNSTVIESIPTQGMKYLMFSFPRSYNNTKRGVVFRHLLCLENSEVENKKSNTRFLGLSLPRCVEHGV